jgi:hypothetical protein
VCDDENCGGKIYFAGARKRVRNAGGPDNAQKDNSKMSVGTTVVVGVDYFYHIGSATVLRYHRNKERKTGIKRAYLNDCSTQQAP